jgi:hypothetical protein
LTSFYKPSIGDQYFANPMQLTQPKVDESNNILRMPITVIQVRFHSYYLLLNVSYQRDLLAAVRNILKSSEFSRENMMNWFTKVLMTNKARAKMQFDPMTSASNGFLLNVCAVLLQLCDKYAGDIHQTKVHSTSSFLYHGYYYRSIM